jgi:hypothetical protein
MRSYTVSRATDLYIWLIGLLIGAVVAVPALSLGTLGLLPAAGMIAWAMLRRPSLPAVSGLATGGGLSISLLVLRAQTACSSPPAGQVCEGPDLSGVLWFAVLLVAVGVLAGLGALRRHRRIRQNKEA